MKKFFIGYLIISVGILFSGCAASNSNNGNNDAGVDTVDDTVNNHNDGDDDTVDPVDSDGDGVTDDLDACPNDINQWTDADHDGFCDEVDDACTNDASGWTDFDGDGHCDENDDACPNDITQWTDADHDGVCDEVDDECPDDPNGWVDSNNDGLCNGDDDADGDGITNGEEEIYGNDCIISDPYSADTDGDGINDNNDPYPRDPFPEYILHRNDLGTIDIMLSNRDGTFATPVEIGEQYGCTSDATHNCPVNSNYRYTGFVISDFDNNGSVDFLAYGDSDPSDPSNPRDLWYFYRSNDINSGGATLFSQRLIDNNLDTSLFRIAGDFNNDTKIDLISLIYHKPSTISDGAIYTYENTGLVSTANCAYTTDPLNPNNCAFIQRVGADVTSLVNNEWSVGIARDAVDVNNDGFRDLALFTIASGGNDPVPVYILEGNGDGTFSVPSSSYFSHNSGACGASPANSILFSDFNNDSIGDIIMGFDDDGDPGSAWFYPGEVNNGLFGFNFSGCFEAVDLNPGNENGNDAPGVSSTATNFDFNFDGNQDIILGWYSPNTWTYPSHTVLYLGNGDGTFQPVITVRDFPNSTYGSSFAIPQRLCAWFPTN